MSFTGEYHRHPTLISFLNHFLVPDASTRLHDVLDAVLVGGFDGIGERKEGIGDENEFFKIRFFLLRPWGRQKVE